MAKRTLLIDGDLVLYRSAIACEREVWWDEQNIVLQTNVEQAWTTVQSTLSRYQAELGTNSVILVFGQGQSFRKGIDPSYKANRKDVRRPLGYTTLGERATEAYVTRSHEGLEGDDMLGILSTKPSKTDTVIVSDDKDMKTIPGLLYRQGELTLVTEDEADYWHMYQTLIGDGSDGYTGLPGCGPKTAEKLLLTPDATLDLGITRAQWMWSQVVNAFAKKGLSADDALIQARLARILRWSDWDNINKRVKLWEP